MRAAWILVWDAVCPGAGGAVWTGFEGDGGLDYCGPAVGFGSWSQQFFLWDIDSADYFSAQEVFADKI